MVNDPFSVVPGAAEPVFPVTFIDVFVVPEEGLTDKKLPETATVKLAVPPVEEIDKGLVAEELATAESEIEMGLAVSVMVELTTKLTLTTDPVTRTPDVAELYDTIPL